MKKLILSIALALPLLTGCALFKKENFPEVSIVDRKIFIDPKLLQPCEPIPSNSVSTPDDVLLENLYLYELYSKCSHKQDNSINAIKLLTK